MDATRPDHTAPSAVDRLGMLAGVSGRRGRRMPGWQCIAFGFEIGGATACSGLVIFLLLTRFLVAVALSQDRGIWHPWCYLAALAAGVPHRRSRRQGDAD